jgi:hypothetical protein
MDRLNCRGFTAGLLRGRGVAEAAVVERRLPSMTELHSRVHAPGIERL